MKQYEIRILRYVYFQSYSDCYPILLQVARHPPWPSGYDAWLRSVRSKVRFSAGPHYKLIWSLYKCVELWRAVYGTYATERTLGDIREEKGISSRFRPSITSRYDLSCCKQRKNTGPSFFWEVTYLTLHTYLFPQICL